MGIELVTTDGIFALDGGEWEVTNNIWIVGDDREVVVFDAAHDHRPIVDAVNGRRVAGDRAHPRPQRPHQRRRAAARRRRRADPAAPRRPDAVGRRCGPDDTPDRRADARARRSRVGGHELDVLHTPATPPAAAASTTPASGVVFSGDTLFCGGPGATGRSYSDEPTILRSIRDALLALPDETIVHTGHGDSTTIGAERDGVLARAAELGL